ncbi:MAG: hypothetical protein KatS3mg011_0712 [Acidimicrobiia bacterium]|nr:MAG: hypothetical protein KatS3mg011_0712 [Acidimicrobiia bacterium]
MKSRVAILTGGVLLGMGVALLVSKPVEAGYSITCWTRSNAVSYSYTALHEGYEWGGGWWTDNNYDDTPSCPTDGGSGCEGPDCSGLVFKSWAMVNSWGSTGKYYWYAGDNVHGPYSSTSFRDGCGGACYDVCTRPCGSGSYSLTIPMDAFAKSGHIGLIWSEGSDGYDDILEAHSNNAGVILSERSYRLSSSYDGVRRKNWSTSC